MDEEYSQTPKLRIAWSVFWALACVLLIVLWVRTNYIYEQVYRSIGSANGVIIASRHGGVAISLCNPRFAYAPYDSFTPDTESIDYASVLGFGIARSVPTFITLPIQIPYWFLSGSAGVLAAAPYIKRPYRFSLRTLLIATTLVAVVLGLAAWTASK